MSPRYRATEAVSLVLYEDPLSPWCIVAERRIVAALEDVAGAFGPLRLEPFPNRLEPNAMTATERRRHARVARRAAREPEAADTTADLWLSPDPPLSSLPPLRALAAARLQGNAREAALRVALREAAFVRGLNISRTDILLELAERAGLDLGRFAGALFAPATEERVRESFEDAEDKGVRVAPALIIGDEWLVAGPRTVAEYRSILRRYVAARLGRTLAPTLH